jgi:hypothetical protein
MKNKDLHNLSEQEFYEKISVEIPEHKTIQEAIEWVLLLLDFKATALSFDENCREEFAFSLRVFDGMVPMSGGAFSARSNMSFLAPSQEGLNLDLLDNNFNIRLLTFNSETSKTVQMGKWRMLPLEELRGRNFYNGRILESRNAFLTKDEKWYIKSEYWKALKVSELEFHELIARFATEEQIQNINKFTQAYKTLQQKNPDFIKHRERYSYKEWIWPVAIKKNYYMRDEDIRTYYFKDKTGFSMYIDTISQFLMSISMALSFYYEWFVYIKVNEKSIGFKIPIDPLSAKDIFSLRSAPLTKDGRKKAICNYVREHYRKIKLSDSDEAFKETLVRQHLRGETKFDWNGLKVNIIPSAYDIKRLKPNKKFMLTA